MIPLATVAVIRLVRDRTNLFFVLVFPLLIVLLLGATFGAGQLRQIGVVTGLPLSDAVAEAIAADGSVEVVELADAASAASAVEDASVEIAVVPGDRSARVLSTPDADASGVASVVDQAIRTQVVADRQADAFVAAGVEGAVAVVASPVDVVVRQVGVDELAEEFANLGAFDLGASQQLLLFVFITSLTSSTAVVQARRWGVLDRVMSGPTHGWQVVAGLGAGQFLVALAQALVIIGGTTVLFGVNWGSPVATGAVAAVFALVAAGAGLLLGALLDNEEQAGGAAVPIALGFAALGGSMLPLELFPDTLRSVARATPHAWGNQAFAEIVRRGGGIGDVLTELSVLAGFAVVLCGLAAWVLRRRLAA